MVHCCFSQYTDSATRLIGYSSTGVLNKTNNGSSYVLNNNLRFGISKKIYSLNFASGWVYGAHQSVLTNNDVTSSLDFNIYKAPPHFYYWGLATHTASYSLKIRYQLQSGLGIGYNIIESRNALIERSNASLIISDGILYETNNLILKDSMTDIYHTFRNSLRLKFRWVIQNIIVIDGTNFWQPSLTNGNDYIIRSLSNLSVKLNKWLNLTASVTYNKYNRTASENLLFTYGLSAEKYF